jgi:hypothetical protein
MAQECCRWCDECGQTLVERLIALCDGYVELGCSVTEQMAAILIEGESAEDQNPAALTAAARWMGEAARFAAEVGGEQGYAQRELSEAADLLDEASERAES